MEGTGRAGSSERVGAEVWCVTVLPTRALSFLLQEKPKGVDNLALEP